MNWELIGASVGIIGFVYGFLRNFKQDLNTRFDGMDKRFDSLENEIRSIDRRLSHLEGAFQERGYWESRKTGTEEKQ